MKTIYKDNIWRQIIHFVKEERWDGEYTRETDLVKDLQLKGDDAYEFICLFSKKFNVDIVDFNFAFDSCILLLFFPLSFSTNSEIRILVLSLFKYDNTEFLCASKPKLCLLVETR